MEEFFCSFGCGTGSGVAGVVVVLVRGTFWTYNGMLLRLELTTSSRTFVRGHKPGAKKAWRSVQGAGGATRGGLVFLTAGSCDRVETP